MGRTARQAEMPAAWTTPLRTGASALLGLVSRNPTIAGGATAFLVALSFVSANALWYQPYAHSGAFFATRDFSRPGRLEQPVETVIRIERPEAVFVDPQADPEIRDVQSILKDLGFYRGDVDGLDGPNTRTAIESYRSTIGMTVTGSVDRELLDQLGVGTTGGAIVPSAAPRGDASGPDAPRLPETAPLPPQERIIKIQAGLRAFGNEGIEIDGLMGARTSAAIREFQALFGLPESGQPDPEVYAKMREIGLTN